MEPFTRITVLVLWLIGLLQLVRFVARWDVRLNGAPIPLWLSLIAAFAVVGLAVMVWREHRKDG
jgi:high-affinity Fe2+/Pb2+ permease